MPMVLSLLAKAVKLLAQLVLVHSPRTALHALELSTFNRALRLASQAAEMVFMQTLQPKHVQPAILHARLALEEQLRLVLLARCLHISNLLLSSVFLLVTRTNTSKTPQLLV